MAAIVVLLLGAGADLAAGTFRVFNRVVSVPEAGDCTNLVLQTDAGTISFLPPVSWRMRFDPGASQIVWTSYDYASVLTLKIVPDPDGSLRRDMAARCKARLAAEDPDLRITSESVCYTAGEPGRSFDIERLIPGRESVMGRVACLPITGAVADLRLLTPASQQQQRQTELVMFLNSFRVIERGQ